MKKMDDHWLRPNTKAGTEEMSKRIKCMRALLRVAGAVAPVSPDVKIVEKVFDEYFSFDWVNWEK